jgi:hypothetical protein
MDAKDTASFEPYPWKLWARSRERQRNVVLHVPRSEKKTRNYNNPIVAARNRVESVGKRRLSELDICLPDIELRPIRPNVRDQLLEFQIRGRFAASVADN